MSIILKSGNSGVLATVNSQNALQITNVEGTYGREKAALPSVSLGKFSANTGPVSVTAAAQSAPAGSVFFWNPTNSTKVIRLRDIQFMQSATTALSCTTAPRIGISRITVAGSGTGTQLAIMKKDSLCPASVAYLSGASTGATLTNVGLGLSFLVNAQLNSGYNPSVVHWLPPEENAIVLRAGEGIVLYQADAGTSSDTRTWNMNLEWDESAT